MDTSLRAINHVKVVEPRIAIDQQRSLAVVSGPKESTFYRDISTSYSTSQVNHAINPPANSIMDSRLVAVWSIQLVFTGTVGSGNLLTLGYDAPRAYPISQTVGTTTISINGQSQSFNNSDMISALAHYVGDQDTKRYMSGTGTMLDTFQQYSDSVNTNQNPLASYGENSYQDTRGSLEWTITANAPTTATVQMRIYEPLFVSPFTWGHRESPGIAGIQNLNVQFAINDLTRSFSHFTNGGSLTSVVPSFYAPPELHYNMLSPNNESNPYFPGRNYVYPFFNVTPQVTSVGTLAAGASGTVTSGVFQINTIPDRLYIFCRQQNADRNVTTSDTFATINNINVTWDIRTGLMSNSTSNDLYRLSVGHGLDSTWSQWNRHQGSVLCLSMGQDIGLMENQAVGMSGQYQFSCTLNITNTSAASVNYSLYVLVVQPGVFITNGTQASFNTSLVSVEDILTARTGPTGSFSQLQESLPFGGSWFGDFFGKVGRFFKNAVGAIPGTLNVASQILGKAAPIVGLVNPGLGAAISTGLGVLDKVRSVTGGARGRTKRMTQAQLMRRLMH